VDEWQGPLFGISTEQTIEPNNAHEAFGFGEEGVYLLTFRTPWSKLALTRYRVFGILRNLDKFWSHRDQGSDGCLARRPHDGRKDSL
jgi:hypothetical protein